MCEILIKAIDPPHAAEMDISDSLKAQRGIMRKGDIVSIKPNGWSDGEHWHQSGYPYVNGGKFIVVKVPTITVAQAVVYVENWSRDITYTLISNNNPTYTFDISVEAQSISQIENITQAQVLRFLRNQDAEILDHGSNWVRVRFTLDADETLNDKKQAISLKLDTIKRRRYCFEPVDVNLVIAAGGIVTLTKNQVLNKIVDKWNLPNG